MKPDTIEEDGKPKTVYHLNVKRHKFICTSCPSYKPRKPLHSAMTPCKRTDKQKVKFHTLRS